MLKSDDLFLFVFREDLAALEEDYVEVMIIKGPLCCQKEKKVGEEDFRVPIVIFTIRTRGIG